MCPGCEGGAGAGGHGRGVRPIPDRSAALGKDHHGLVVALVEPQPAVPPCPTRQRCRAHQPPHNADQRSSPAPRACTSSAIDSHDPAVATFTGICVATERRWHNFGRASMRRAARAAPRLYQHYTLYENVRAPTDPGGKASQVNTVGQSWSLALGAASVECAGNLAVTAALAGDPEGHRNASGIVSVAGRGRCARVSRVGRVCGVVGLSQSGRSGKDGRRREDAAGDQVSQAGGVHEQMVATLNWFRCGDAAHFVVATQMSKRGRWFGISVTGRRWWSLTAGSRHRRPAMTAGMSRTSDGPNTGHVSHVRPRTSVMTAPL